MDHIVAARAGAGVAEVAQRAIALAQHQVGIAIAAEVGKDRRALRAEADAAEPIGTAGTHSEGRRQGRAGVLVVLERAAALAGDKVEIAVAVQIDKARRGKGADTDAAERIGRAGDLDVDRRQRIAGIAVILERAIVGADHQVKVAVTVQVNEGRRTGVTDIDAVERIGSTGARRVDRRRGRASILEVRKAAVAAAHDQVKIAIAIKVCEGRRRHGTDINAIEGIGRTGAHYVDRRSARAGVLEIRQAAVARPHQQVEVAVAVDVGEGRSASAADIEAAQRIAGTGLQREADLAGVDAAERRDASSGVKADLTVVADHDVVARTGQRGSRERY